MSKTPTMYIIVDKATGKLDWDMELHPTVEACVQSMTGDRQEFGDAASDPRRNWREVYEIRRVLPLANRPVQYRMAKP